jgi:hypothetical protein
MLKGAVTEDTSSVLDGVRLCDRVLTMSLHLSALILDIENNMTKKASNRAVRSVNVTSQALLGGGGG